jgi:CBS domain-containing protein
MNMFSQTVRQVMHGEQLVTVSRSTLVSEAARLMSSHSVSAVVVVDDQAAAGIFTERDAVCRVLAQDLDPHDTPIGGVMTPLPVTVESDRSFGHALALMHEHGCRHVPVVEAGRVVGLVTARDALDPELEDFVCEAQRRQNLE